jgi:hypothetical protein
MHLIDEIIRDFKEKGYIQELAVLSSLDEKYKNIEKFTAQVNVLKAELSDLSRDEQLYLDCKLQAAGVDLGLCPDLYIFFSNKNNCFHHCCQRNNKKRTFCRGQINKCSLSV